MNNISELLNFTGKNMGVIEVSASNVSSLPTTIASDRILAKHACVKAVLSNPNAQRGDWTVTASAGSVQISGTISGTTDITLYLALKTNESGSATTSVVPYDKVSSGTAGVTATTGSVYSAYVRRCGKIIMLRVVAQNSSTTASGGDFFKGKLTTASLLPAISLSSPTYWATHAVIGFMDESGNITIRNASSTNIASVTGTSTIGVTFVYIAAN